MFVFMLGRGWEQSVRSSLFCFEFCESEAELLQHSAVPIMERLG